MDCGTPRSSRRYHSGCSAISGQSRLLCISTKSKMTFLPSACARLVSARNSARPTSWTNASRPSAFSAWTADSRRDLLFPLSARAPPPPVPPNPLPLPTKPARGQPGKSPVPHRRCRGYPYAHPRRCAGQQNPGGRRAAGRSRRPDGVYAPRQFGEPARAEAASFDARADLARTHFGDRRPLAYPLRANDDDPVAVFG